MRHPRFFVHVLVVALALAFAAPAIAIGPNEALPDAAEEARARALFKELRCLVCQNQSIDDSEAELARDLRVIVRERVQAGDSDREILEFLTRRYGDFVLLRPPLRPATWVLWFGPFALLALGAAGVWIVRRRRTATAPAPVPLAESERERLRHLLASDPAERDRP